MQFYKSRVSEYQTLNAEEIEIHCYRCECKIVSSQLHFPYHSMKISSCKLCGCDDVAMKNCEKACQLISQAYTLTGCGKIVKESKVKYAWEASSCSSGLSNEDFSCS